MNKSDHTHKYERRKLGSWKKFESHKTSGPDVYKCAVPGCTHYMINLDMVVGRYSRCWGIVGLSKGGDVISCPNEVEMTRYMVFSEKRKRPLCQECKERRKQEREDKQVEAKIEMLEKMIEGRGNKDVEIHDEY